MDDTLPSISEKMIELLRKKTPEERLTMGCSMFEFSRQLVISALLRRNPGLAPAALRKELFLRFYGSDFEPTKRDKIAAYLERSRSESGKRKA